VSLFLGHLNLFSSKSEFGIHLCIIINFQGTCKIIAIDFVSCEVFILKPVFYLPVQVVDGAGGYGG
jgi:hypothetical protein